MVPQAVMVVRRRTAVEGMEATVEADMVDRRLDRLLRSILGRRVV